MLAFCLEIKEFLHEYLHYRGVSDKNGYLICTSKGEPIARRTIQDEIAKYNQSRGVQKTSIHLMRHTFAKNSIKAGVDIYTLMKRMNHNSIDTTIRYLRELGLDVKSSVNMYNPQKLFCVGNSKIKMKV